MSRDICPVCGLAVSHNPQGGPPATPTYEELQAQVKRVREVAESIRDAADKARGFHGSPIQWERQKVAEDILRALDGGDDGE